VTPHPLIYWAPRGNSSSTRQPFITPPTSGQLLMETYFLQARPPELKERVADQTSDWALGNQPFKHSSQQPTIIHFIIMCACPPASQPHGHVCQHTTHTPTITPPSDRKYASNLRTMSPLRGWSPPSKDGFLHNRIAPRHIVVGEGSVGIWGSGPATDTLSMRPRAIEDRTPTPLGGPGARKGPGGRGRSRFDLYWNLRVGL
jgi:hypothetical protein